MSDPLLSTLCTICHIHTPKYTCPRCSVQTCSLPCVRRHKLWSSCSGVRDATVFKPRSELLTAAGVDHDYNFLHSIEHQIERSEKIIVEEKRIVRRNELKEARQGLGPDSKGGRRKSKPHQAPGEQCIDAMLKMMGTRVHRAPKGMQRSLENGTNWSKNTRQINWQVELMRNGGSTRQLTKFLNNKCIGYYYDEWLEGDRRNNMTEEQKRHHKKRKADEVKQRATKRTKLATQLPINTSTTSYLQNPETGAWDVEAALELGTATALPFSAQTYRRLHDHQLFLLRPRTSSKYPKVLVPVDPFLPLSEILKKREVVEFPTIYIFETPLDTLPDGFILESEYLAATRQSSYGQYSTATEDSISDESESSQSVSGDEEMEDGEIEE